MKTIIFILFGSAGWAHAQPADTVSTSLLEEVRQIRLVLQQQQKLSVTLELIRARGQRILALEARLEQVEADLTQQRRRLSELTTASTTASADDRAVLTDQFRRTTETITELETAKTQSSAHLAAETREQDDLLKVALK